MAKTIIPRNLSNVFTTALRVLKSGNRIGIFQLFLYALSIPLIPLDVALGAIQGAFMTRTHIMRKPVIFISGYSRSGTTLLYQALSKNWDVEYFNNVLILFPRSYILANYLYRKFSKARPADFRSFYGLSRGLYGTNDGAQIFYQWASEEDFIYARRLQARSAEDMEKFFRTHERCFKKTLLTKNCNLYQMFAQFAEILPNSYFIFVKRDPEKIIQSTLKAREFVQGDRTIPWEVSYKNARGGHEDPIEEICRNVKYCFDRIEEFREKAPAGRFFVVEYEAFCKDPVKVIGELTSGIFKTEVDYESIKARVKPFRASDGPALDRADSERIQDMVRKVFAP